MNDLNTNLRQLEACVQEEHGAQARVLERLKLQATALQGGDQDEIATATRALEGELVGLAARAERRNALMRRLAGLWGVSARALTLSSIAERAGAEGARLVRMRAGLRRVTADVARQSRRNAQTAKLHQRTWNRLFEDVLDELVGSDASARGRLVDAEA